MQRRILLVDDHPTFCLGLRLVLDALPDCAPPDAAASQAQAMAKLADAERFDLIIYDWYLPDGGGVRGLLALMQLAPEVPVIVISSAEEEAIRLAALQLGARAFLCKSAAPAAICRLVAEALGLAPVADAAAPPSSALPTAVAALATLTSRQTEVLRHLAQGASNKEISRRLGISSLTVRTHVAHIMAALHAHNRTQAVVTAVELGLVARLDNRRR